MSEIALQILLFEGVAFLLLAAVFVSRRFFRQPIDRIRLTQAGFGLIAVAAVCVGYGIGPTWTITHLAGTPVQETATEEHSEEQERMGVSPPGFGKMQ